MKKAATNDVTAIYLPRGNVLELLLESGHRWRGFLHVRKPIRHTFYFLSNKGRYFIETAKYIFLKIKMLATGFVAPYTLEEGLARTLEFEFVHPRGDEVIFKSE